MGSGYLGKRAPDMRYSTIIVGTPKIRKILKPFLKRRSQRQMEPAAQVVALTNKNEMLTMM
jgi:hypothetical protein